MKTRDLCLIASVLLLATPVLAQDGVLTPRPTRYQVAGLFGESDEEIAKRQQHEDGQDAAVQQLRQRVTDLEDSLRRQTGQNEQLSHRLQELQQRMDRMQKDFDYKLCAAISQQMSSPDNPGAVPCAGGPAPSGFAPAPQALNVPQDSAPAIKLAPPPSNLGTLPASTALPNATAAPAMLPDSPTRAEFDAAMRLLGKAQYEEARSAFRSFADTYPKDDLTPQAVYWVGYIGYARGDFPGAARAFAEEIKKFPNSPRAPESMLKLGQSFIAMNQIKEGCTTLGALPQRYPNASKTVTSKAAEARKASCTKQG